MAFTRDKLLERMERFQAFLPERQGISFHKIDSLEKGNHRYMVWSNRDRELAMVTFTYTGGVELTAPAGKVKEAILDWVAQEVCPCHERSGAGELAKLDAFRHLLNNPDAEHDSSSFPPSGSLQMTSQDNPLVELAELLGYSIYLLPRAEPLAPRYAIVNEQAVAATGKNLAKMIAQLLTGQAGEEASGSLPPLPGTVYLPRNARYRLADLRIHTRWNGTWMTQQMLANLAGVNVSTVHRIEKEHRRPEHSHIYLSTAKSILAVLNEARQREGLPLIQLWNIDWTAADSETEIL